LGRIRAEPEFRVSFENRPSDRVLTLPANLSTFL
jgi:hypothetical protein